MPLPGAPGPPAPTGLPPVGPPPLKQTLGSWGRPTLLAHKEAQLRNGTVLPVKTYNLRFFAMTLAIPTHLTHSAGLGTGGGAQVNLKPAYLLYNAPIGGHRVTQASAAQLWASCLRREAPPPDQQRPGPPVTGRGGRGLRQLPPRL